MTTFDDDFVQLEFPVTGETRRIALKELGLEWPPPETFKWHDAVFLQTSMSEITDEDRAGMTHVCRGAAYRLIVPSEARG